MFILLITSQIFLSVVFQIFGPVMQILKFKTIDEAIERANNTTYGLGAGVFTSNLENAIMTSHGIRAGLVW
jgi:acyl-CoA reductase-like NAD-dependent aldehyde dehydrogenase